MRRTVLVVDDSLAITRHLKSLLEEGGEYEVIANATNGSEGLKLFEQLKPDLVLLDIVMPVMGGIECLRLIKQRDPEARVVLISSVGGVERKAETATKLGALGVINKPFEPETVLAVLESIFAGE